ncbi:MAG: 3-hydroxy-3-methylglutaryl-ACP synthase [Verrucomicrobia bacterium]|nr:3-hydroxy-3-methylglutaryl-ACP synthase [Verrucomicrobiota bacterium]
MEVGIEAINAYCAQAYIEVRTLFEGRGLDLSRFDNLMMEKKAVGLPCEDPITHAVNAAKPMLDQMPERDRDRIELVITATESGVDFAKSVSAFAHRYLGLNRNCRLFEIKQACYAGTAALQMAANFIRSGASPGAKALVLATDVIMIGPPEVDAEGAEKFSYAEPSGGVAGVAMLVGDHPSVLELDFGANGYFSYEVCDVFRPRTQGEVGDPDLSLLSYLDCAEGAFRAYAAKVDGADYQTTFDYLAFHTPFAGMVKGAHRKAMRVFKQATTEAIEADFRRRVLPSLQYCMEVGGAYSATLYLALASLLDHAEISQDRRVGLFSYGSGCSSEFFSGVVTPAGQAQVRRMGIGRALAQRLALSMEQYERLLRLSMEFEFGTRDREIPTAPFQELYDRQFAGKGLLVLRGVRDYIRAYAWS